MARAIEAKRRPEKHPTIDYSGLESLDDVECTLTKFPSFDFDVPPELDHASLRWHRVNKSHYAVGFNNPKEPRERRRWPLFFIAPNYRTRVLMLIRPESRIPFLSSLITLCSFLFLCAAAHPFPSNASTCAQCHVIPVNIWRKPADSTANRSANRAQVHSGRRKGNR
jgi:hypothetical protein